MLNLAFYAPFHFGPGDFYCKIDRNHVCTLLGWAEGTPKSIEYVPITHITRAEMTCIFQVSQKSRNLSDFGIFDFSIFLHVFSAQFGPPLMSRYMCNIAGVMFGHQ